MKRSPILRIHGTSDEDELVVDNFAGGGGASSGIEWAIGRSPDIAINHDLEAIAMHKANHPTTKHYVADVFDVSPREACGGRPVGLAWFSPDCTYHSKARGGVPFRDKDKARRRRGLAGVVIKWADQVKPRLIALENVEEFAAWGPLKYDENKKRYIPDPEKKGQSFKRWWKRLEKLGYHVDSRELRACDYGAPTTRKRLFVLASLDGPPVWPEPTHAPRGDLFLKPYRTAAECIDWSIPCPSIFMTKKQAKAWTKKTGIKIKRPLSKKTLRRIAAGVIRFVLKSANPFIVPVTHGKTGQRSHDINDPMRTVTGANRGELALVTPYLVEYHDPRREGDDRARGVEEPLPTQDTSNRFGLAAPVLIQTSWGERKGQRPRYLNIHEPLGTIMGGGVKHSVVAAYLAKHFGGEHKNGTPKATGSPVDDPLDTITARDHNNLVAAHLVNLKGSMDDRQVSGGEMHDPVGTICAGGTHVAQVFAFLTKYYSSKEKKGRDTGATQNEAVDQPLHTIPTVDRYGLITVTIAGERWAIVDIGMRMLKPRELFIAQGFSPEYKIDPKVERWVGRGKKKRLISKALTPTAQVRMCGNSVSPYPTEAVIRANYRPRQGRMVRAA